jgi:AraC-like DNA-binding protein
MIVTAAALRINERLRQLPIDLHKHPKPFIQNGLHWHDGVEINYCSCGQGCVDFAPAEEVALAPGVLVIFDAYRPHGTTCAIELPFTSYSLHVDSDLFSALCGPARKYILPAPGYCRCLLLSPIVRPVVEAALEEIVNGAVHTNPDVLLRLNTQLLKILTIAFEACAGTIPMRNSPLVTAAIQYIDEHLGDDLAVRNLAAALGYNRSYLSFAFRQHTGETLSRYVRRCRLEAAAKLLLTTSKSTVEIGRIVGYYDASQFSRVFRAFYSVPPGQYRRTRIHLH